MRSSIITRLERLEKKVAAIASPQLAPRVRYNPRTREYLDPVPNRPFVPEPYFTDEADWENYHLTVQRELRKHMPERN